MNDNELLIKIKAETDKATKDIQTLTKRVTQLTKENKKFGNTAKDTAQVKKSYEGLSKTIKGLAAAYLSIEGVKGVFDLAEDAAKAQQSADAFKRTFEAMGLNAEVEFNKIKEASKGLIPDAAIQQASVKAASLGVPIESLAGLMEVAVASSRDMGITVTQAFDDIATGIGRGSPMIIDNLGISLKLGDAYKAMADKLHITVEELTAQQKVQALTNEVLRAGAEAVKKYADAALTPTQKMEILNSEMENLKVKIGTQLLPVLLRLADSTTEFIQSISTDDLKAIEGGIILVVNAAKGLIETLGSINDFLMPDWLPWADENSTLLGTVAEGWGNIGRQIQYTREISEGWDRVSGHIDEVAAIQQAVASYDGLKGSYESLSEKLIDMLEKNHKLQEQFRNLGTEEAKEGIVLLQREEQAILEATEQLAEQRPFDGAKKSAEEAKDAVVQYSEKQLEEITKTNDKRIKESGKTIEQLSKNEEQLVKEIESLHSALAEKLKKIDQERFESNLSIEEKIKEIGYQQLTETEAYYTKQKDAAVALSQAKEALYAGELEKYKEYISQYESLATGSAGKAIEAEGKVLVSKQETSKAGVEALNNIKTLENEYYDQKALKAQEAHDAAVLQKEIELESIKAQLEAQKELLKVSKELAEALSGKKIAIDTTPVDNAIKRIDDLKTSIKTTSSTPGAVKVNTSSVTVAKQKVEELKTLTLNGTTLDVDADTTPADFGIKKLVTDVEDDHIRMIVNPEYKEAQKKIDNFRRGEKKNPLDVEVKPDTRAFDARMKQVKKPTSSKHSIDPNTRSIDSAIKRIQRPTSSTHTIYERVVPARAGGGPIPQNLAVGGTFTGNGKVPGYDPTDGDKVNAKLTGGEFVIKRQAVDAFGTRLLHDINNMTFRMPKLPAFATGGEVGGGSSVNTIGSNVVPININIGAKTFPVMGGKDVADALVKYMKMEGGL